jgi:lysine 2,3-aminomutase
MVNISEFQEELVGEIHHDFTEVNWRDWKWHIKYSIRSLATVEHLLGIEYEPELREQLLKTIEHFPMSITPYYFSLINRDDYENCPIYKQSVPDPRELIIERSDFSDPLAEDKDSPVPGITHRYPDRVLFHVSNVCAMYCRHCTRKRKVGDIDSIPTKENLRKGIEYIRNTSVVRDVLFSGGDPFLLSDENIDCLLDEIRSIPHVEIIRIGTRTPAVLPGRITKELVDILKQYHPLYINTHFNHPREMTASARNALAMLADAGIPLGNQSVLLAGVNDCPRIMKGLVHQLLKARVRPYYLYQCDMSEGLSHFRTPVGKGIEVLESLIGHTSGLAVPTYVIDTPSGGGKVPILPNYILSWSTNKVVTNRRISDPSSVTATVKIAILFYLLRKRMNQVTAG